MNRPILIALHQPNLFQPPFRGSCGTFPLIRSPSTSTKNSLWVALKNDTTPGSCGRQFPFLCYIITQYYLCLRPAGRVAVPVDLVFSSASQGLTPLQRNTGKGFTEDHPPVTTNNQTQQQQRRMEQKTFPFFSVFHLLLSLFHLWPHLDHLKTHLDVNDFCQSKKKHSKATIILKSGEAGTKNI